MAQPMDMKSKKHTCNTEGPVDTVFRYGPQIDILTHFNNDNGPRPPRARLIM